VESAAASLSLVPAGTLELSLSLSVDLSLSLSLSMYINPRYIASTSFTTSIGQKFLPSGHSLVFFNILNDFGKKRQRGCGFAIVITP